MAWSKQYSCKQVSSNSFDEDYFVLIFSSMWIYTGQQVTWEVENIDTSANYLMLSYISGMKYKLRLMIYFNI